jgi:death-on-curing protein
MPRAWLDRALVEAVHAETIAEFGGEPGLRDAGLLEAALARPRNKAAYSRASAFVLASAYAFGIARNHPFVDGNKRVALITAFVFLELNGWTVEAPEEDAATAFLDLAAGRLSEASLGVWLKRHSIAVRKRRTGKRSRRRRTK